MVSNLSTCGFWTLTLMVANFRGKLSPMVTELLAGMSVALYTTLVGAVLHLWLMVNYHLLAGGAARLVVALIGLGEANARP